MSTKLPIKLLLVDDEEELLETTRDSLEEFVEKIEIAPRGAAAIELLTAQPFDAVISDYNMPKMNGVEFLRQAAALRPELKLILMTGYSDEAAVQTALKELHFSILNKPSPPNDIVTLLKQLTGK